MKLAFTTLGCPEWDLDTILSRAVEYSFDGVDFRGYQRNLEIYRLPEFSSQSEETAGRFAHAGLEVPCFSSSAYILEKPEDYNLMEVTEYSRLCEVFGASFVRVFGGRLAKWGGARAAAVEEMARSLDRMAGIASKRGVRVIIETHDDWGRGGDLLSVMRKVDADAVGVLWDTHNTYEAGETPGAVWADLGEWIAYTHWKDSKEPEGLCLFGAGESPVEESLRVLAEGGYDGYLTFEWEKHWRPGIEEPEVAFPAYVKTMRRLLSEQRAA